MDRFQKVASEILERICSFRTDNDGWKTAKQTVCTNLMIDVCLVINSSVYEQFFSVSFSRKAFESGGQTSFLNLLLRPGYTAPPACHKSVLLKEINNATSFIRDRCVLLRMFNDVNEHGVSRRHKKSKKSYRVQGHSSRSSWIDFRKWLQK